MIKKVFFVFSSPPGSFCGVGDYTSVLLSNINKLQPIAQLATVPRWSLKNLFGIFKKYPASSGSGFHLQYPSNGMGNSLAPFMVPYFGKISCVTLHEFECFSFLRKLALLPLILRTRKIIFTNDYERAQFLRFFPFAEAKTMVIPIGNNITVAMPSRPYVRRKRLVYFGQIVKQKGIDFFIDSVIAMRASGCTIECAIMGSVVDQELWQSLQPIGKQYNIELLPDLSMEKVSEELQQSTYALLPFVDGISEKRGSALSCFAHGVTVITRFSGKSPAWMKEASYEAETPEEAAKVIISLAEGKQPRQIDTTKLGSALRQREWSEISRQHIQLYQQLA